MFLIEFQFNLNLKLLRKPRACLNEILIAFSAEMLISSPALTLKWIKILANDNNIPGNISPSPYSKFSFTMRVKIVIRIYFFALKGHEEKKSEENFVGKITAILIFSFSPTSRPTNVKKKIEGGIWRRRRKMKNRDPFSGVVELKAKKKENFFASPTQQKIFFF